MAASEYVVKSLKLLSATWPNGKLDDPVIAGFWAGALVDLDGPTLLLQVIELCQTSTEEFLPKPGIIRRLVTGDPDALTGEEAWELVLAQVKANGHTRPWDLPEPVRTAQRRVVPESVLNSAPASDMISHRMRFLECFRGISEKTARLEATSPELRVQIAANREKVRKLIGEAQRAADVSERIDNVEPGPG